MLCTALTVHALYFISAQSNPIKIDVMGHVSERGKLENNWLKVTELAGMELEFKIPPDHKQTQPGTLGFTVAKSHPNGGHYEKVWMKKGYNF